MPAPKRACKACGDPAEGKWHNEPYCYDCFMEKTMGIIPNPAKAEAWRALLAEPQRRGGLEGPDDVDDPTDLEEGA
jgi:hypothetical protein